MAKYVIIVPDGAADEALEQLDNQTALEAAHIPHMDAISRQGRQGVVQTVPQGLAPGSDVAQMSLLGYDPQRYYSGRAPIEAVAQDIRLACHGLDKNDNDFVIGVLGRELYPCSAVIQAMRKTKQTSQYLESLGPFFIGKAIWQSKF